MLFMASTLLLLISLQNKKTEISFSLDHKMKTEQESRVKELAC